MKNRTRVYEQSIHELHESKIELIRIEIKKMRQASITIAVTAMIMAFVLLF